MRINKAIATYSGGIAIVGAIVVLVSYFGISMMAGIQTSITAHKNLTEAQQRIVMHMLLFVQNPEHHANPAYKKACEIVKDQRRAINELSTPKPDFSVVEAGLSHGELSEEDVRDMSRIFVYLKSYEPFKEALNRWRASNASIAALQQTFRKVKARQHAGELSKAETDTFMTKVISAEARLDDIDDRLTFRQTQISDWLEIRLKWASIIVGLLLAGLGSFFTIKLRESIGQWKNEMETSWQHYLSLFKNSSIPIFSFDQDGCFTSLNPQAVSLLDRSDEELNGKKVSEIFRPEDRTALQKSIEKTLKGERPIFEGQCRDGSGAKHILYVVFIPIEVKGRIVGAYGIAQDITEFRKAQHEKEANYARFRQLFDYAPFGLCLLNIERKVEAVNQRFLEKFGYKRDEVIGNYLEQLIVGADQHGEIRDVVNSITSGTVIKTETVRYRKDGKAVNIILGAVPVQLYGENIGYYGIYVDITERKRSERRLNQMLREKQVMIQEIHHRVKNNLAVISGLLELQLMYAPNDEVSFPLEKSLERVHSMATIHELLYKAEDFHSIAFDKYLAELPGLFSDRLDPERIDIVPNPVTMNVNQAIPCALLLNELVLKLYQQRLKNCDGSYLRIELSDEEECVQLLLEDENCSTEKSFSLLDENEPVSLMLIDTLKEQLNAELQLQQNGSARISMTFQKEYGKGAYSSLL